MKRLANETTEQFLERISKPIENSGVETLWPLSFTANHLEPGLVRYQDLNMTLLIRKPAIDKMRESFKGRPVINEIHKTIPTDLPPKEFEEWLRENSDGIVSLARWNEMDAWDWVDFLVWDVETKKNCQNGIYAVSCAYLPTEVDKTPGVYHSIPYDGEILNGVYTHLAIVPNPRYEQSRILANSKGGSSMWKIFKWLSGKRGTELANAEGRTMQIDGETVKVKDLVKNYQEDKAAQTEKDRLANESAADHVTEDDVIEIDGDEVKMSDLVKGHRNRKNAEKAEAEKAEAAKAEEKKNAIEAERKNALAALSNAHDAGEHKDKKVENCEKCNAAETDEEKAKREALEKKNAEDKAKKEAEEKAEEEKKNAAFQALQNAAARRGEPQNISLQSKEERVATGKARYGSEPEKK